jgi:hypothetical protein
LVLDEIVGLGEGERLGGIAPEVEPTEPVRANVPLALLHEHDVRS